MNQPDSNKPPTDPRRPEDQEELVQQDDAVIGRAVKRSILALVIVGLVAGAVVFVMSHGGSV